MNLMQKYLNAENRRKILNYLRWSSYNSHPELKIKGVPNQRWKFLMTMRDLRLWIEENAPYSSRAQKYKAQIYQINEELNYLQFRAMILPFLMFVAFDIWFMYWAPKHYKGSVSLHSRPV